MKALWDKIKDPIIRSIRTFAQVAVGTYLLAFTGIVPGLADLGNWDIIQASLAAGILAFLWNVSESLGGAQYPRG